MYLGSHLKDILMVFLFGGLAFWIQTVKLKFAN